MSDDLTAAVAEAIGHDPWCAIVERKGPDNARYECSCDGMARACAALDTILARGGVTDDEWAAAVHGPHPIVTTRELAARAIVTACAERDAELRSMATRFHAAHDKAQAERDEARAEIERLRGRRGPDNEAWHEGRKRGSDEAHAAHRAVTDAAIARADRAEAERDEMRAEVERLADSLDYANQGKAALEIRAERAEAQVQRVRDVLLNMGPEDLINAWCQECGGAEPLRDALVRAMAGEADR